MSEQKQAFIETCNIQPLGSQFGAFHRKSLPDVLHRVLFEGDNAAYAILDGNRIPNIEECLETSGLRNECLFVGDIPRDMREAAPWLVQLEDDNPFTRSLFTRGDGPRCRWGANPGILIRGHGDFDMIRRHFRRLTRIRSASGEWFYFRFWEPSLWPHYVKAITNDAERIAHWTLYRNLHVIFEIISIDSEAETFTRMVVPSPPMPTNTQFRLDSRETEAFQAYRHQRFYRRLSVHLSSESSDFALLSQYERLCKTETIACQARHYGINIEKAVADFATAHVLSGGAMMYVGLCRMILESDDHQIDKGRKLLTEVRTRIAI